MKMITVVTIVKQSESSLSEALSEGLLRGTNDRGSSVGEIGWDGSFLALKRQDVGVDDGPL